MKHLLLLAALALAYAQMVHSHGGALHPLSPAFLNSTKLTVGSVSKFSVYDADKSSAFTPGPVNFFPTTQKALRITGKINVVTYLDSTCTETSSLVPNLVVRMPNNKALPNNTKIYAYGFTGNCSTGVSDLYRGDAAKGDSRLNLMWWREGFTNAKGQVTGSAPNTFAIRRPPAVDALRSLLLVVEGYPLMCGDLKYNTFDAKAWDAKKKACNPAGDLMGR